MNKKISLILMLNGLYVSPAMAMVAEKKEAPAAGSGISISSGKGGFPVRHIVDLPKIPEFVFNMDSFNKTAEILSKSDALERAAKELKDIKINIAPLNVTSDALKDAAKALSHITITPKIPIDHLTTKCSAATGFTYSLVSGGHPAITCFLGAITFIPYPILKKTSWKLWAELNRCFTHKGRPAHQVVDRRALTFDLEAALIQLKDR